MRGPTSIHRLLILLPTRLSLASCPVFLRDRKEPKKVYGHTHTHTHMTRARSFAWREWILLSGSGGGGRRHYELWVDAAAAPASAAVVSAAVVSAAMPSDPCSLSTLSEYYIQYYYGFCCSIRPLLPRLCKNDVVITEQHAEGDSNTVQQGRTKYWCIEWST